MASLKKRKKKILLGVTACAAAFLILFVLLIAFLPRFIDLEPLGKEIASRLSRELEGEILFERIEIFNFPRPHIVFHKGTFSIPHLRGRLESLTAYPAIFPLMRKKIRLHSLDVQQLEVHWTLPLEGMKDGPPNFSEALVAADDRVLRPLLDRLSSAAPGLSLGINNGSVTIARGDHVLFRVEEVNAHLFSPPGDLRVELTAKTNLGEEISLAGRLDSKTLKGSADVDLVRFRPQLLAEALSFGSPLRVEASPMDATLRIEKTDHRSIRGEIRGTLSDLILAGESGSAAIRGTDFSLEFATGPEDASVSLIQLNLLQPRLKLSGNLRLRQNPRNIQMRLIGEKIDIGSTRRAAQLLSGEKADRLGFFQFLREGKSDRFEMQSEGASFSDLTDLKNLRIKGSLSNGTILIPEREMLLEDVQGEATISNGLLEGDHIIARYGEARGGQGTLKLGLQGEDSPFHLDIMVQAPLQPLLPFLDSVLQKGPLTRELALVKGLEGRAKGRLILGETIGSINPTIRVSDFSLRARYGRVPFPVTITEGQVSYEGTRTRSMLFVSGLKANFLDASVTVAGRLKDFVENRSTLDLDARGNMGKRSLEWIFERAHLPAEANLRAPLSLSRLHLARESDGRFSLSGDLVTPGGPAISFALVRSGEWLKIERLALEDKQSRALFTLELREKTFSLGFKGDLQKSTLDRVLVRQPYLSGYAKGDLNAHVPVENPELSQVQGTFQAEGIQIPGFHEKTLRVEEVRLSASKEVLEGSALVSFATFRFSIVGNVTAGRKPLSLRLNLNGKGIVWEDLEAIFQTGDQGKKAEGLPALWGLPLKGEANIELDYLQYQGFLWSPFKGQLQFGPKNWTLRTGEASVCTISTPGALTISPDGFRLGVDLKARNESLDAAVTCLGGPANLAVGRFDLQASLVGAADQRPLIRSLEGAFEFNAKDGRIYRLSTLAKIFAVLNVTEILRGKLPDLQGEGFAYNKFEAKGTMKDGKISILEGLIDGPSLKMAFTGDLNVSEKKIDLVVLLVPFKTLDVVIENIPILGGIAGDALTSIPIRVRGDLTDPVVIPLSPSAVTSNVMGLFGRILRFPLKLIQPLIPGPSKGEK